MKIKYLIPNGSKLWFRQRLQRSDLTIMAKVLQFRNPKKMVFGSEISSNKDELDFELLRNEINYILECILVNAL